MFQAADGGTLFLDEIGEMSPDLQASLLRVLQDGEVRPVGAETTENVDVRLIAATNRDLEAALEDGAFRRDLYYRIAVVTIEMPPLRERRDDIPLLAGHFLEKKDAASVRMASDFLGALRTYRWPGNVRELENVIDRALVLREEEGLLRIQDLPAHLVEDETPGPYPGFSLPDEGISLAEVEKGLIAQALEKAGGNRSKAARLLGITRQTLLYRMEKYDLK
jgi:two-component system NtrC family response regulator